MTDRVKESLFNIIGVDIVGSSMLDLFAGTGSIGIEALSRGAQYVRLLDQSETAIRVIQHNLLKTKLVDRAETLQTNSLRYIIRSADRAFEYIYVAPPQYKKLWLNSIQNLDVNPSWISNDGWVIVQIHPIEFVELELTTLSLFDVRKYGSTLLAFYARTT